ncbi:PadR family transcriptional regulator [Rhodococcus sp. NPDC003318]|uniref:PadR family transcriptional regulator n=1 Tax=Rhodococcus sp. NPDC003318 TaxID=3364503 RepID=UPI00369D3B1F
MENIQRNFDHRGRRPRPGRVGRVGRREGFGPGFGGGEGFGPGDGFGPGMHGRPRRGHGPMDERLGRGRGRGGRGRRGDVRSAVLLLLGEEPMHGYELIQRIAERSGGVWKPSPGSIYPALAQLEDEGLVLIDKVDGRKTARLTESGTAYVEEHRDELGNPWDEIKAAVGRPAQELRALTTQLAGAVRQVAAVGTPEQAKAAGDVLTEARRAIYRILADEAGHTDEAGPGTEK